MRQILWPGPISISEAGGASNLSATLNSQQEHEEYTDGWYDKIIFDNLSLVFDSSPRPSECDCCHDPLEGAFVLAVELDRPPSILGPVLCLTCATDMALDRPKGVELREYIKGKLQGVKPTMDWS